MAYEVLARKWRPGQFADVVGQDHVTRTLENAIKTDRVAHAYLFIGPRGTGKTSIARIFAKALNCAEGPTPKPCDVCPSCREVAAGSGLDVQEIDGASHRGIDEIRSLRDTVKYAPAGRYKIYIIDEVHMLTSEAFNALLKTLEEPPAHVKFLFATTEPHKVPLTILSRCQRFDLRRISVKLLTDRLFVIAESEKVAVDENVLSALARAAEGSLRDAESGLDQLISFKGRAIREEDVISVFGLISRQAMEDMTSAVLRGDIIAVVGLVEEFDRQGKDMQRMLIELLEHFLHLLVLKQGGYEVIEAELDPAMVDTLKRQAEEANVERLLKAMEILIETMDRLRYALSRKTLVETALIRCARASVAVSLDSILAQVRELRSSVAGESGGAPAASRPAETKREPVPAAKEGSSSSAVRGRGVEEELALLKKKWSEMIEHMGRVAILAKNALLDAAPVAITGDVITVGFDPEFPDRIEHMQVSRNRQALHKELSRVLGRKVSAELMLMDERPDKVSEPAGGITETPASSNTGKAGTIRKWIENDTVRKTMDMFNGTIIDVKECKK